MCEPLTPEALVEIRKRYFDESEMADVCQLVVELLAVIALVTEEPRVNVSALNCEKWIRMYSTPAWRECAKALQRSGT